MEIFAHRGLLNASPAPIENSMRALDLAFQAGFSIETDFRWGLDREILVFHDPRLSRIFNLNQATSETSAARLRAQYEGLSGLTEPGPAGLGELLDWPALDHGADGPSVLVNIKEPDDADFVAAVCETIERAGRVQSTWLFDLRQSLIPDLHNAFPKIRFLARFSHLEGEGIEDVRTIAHAVQGVWFDDYYGEILGSPLEQKVIEIGLPLFYVSPELHSETHPLGRVGYDGAWRQVLKNDAYIGICTDHPIEFRETLTTAR